MRILAGLSVIIWFVAGIETSAQPAASSFPQIRIRISPGQYDNLLKSKGEKMILKSPVMTVNQETAVVKEIHSRGNNSLTFEHKSLAVELEKAITVTQDGKTVKLKKFDLMNLVMDKNLWHNRWAFLNMAKIGIFPLFNTYTTVWINDQPQGIYLLVEKPRHYTSGDARSPYMIRRGPEHNIEDEYIDTDVKDEAKKYKKQFQALYDDIGKFKGEELYIKLNTSLYLNHYFNWMAFNYLIMNGDYMDELYLYIQPKTGQFDVIPWDYDDILRPVPHEGARARNAVQSLKNKLVFSSEDPLDRAIGSDEYVYRMYEQEFRKLLQALPPEDLKAAADQVAAELESLSRDGASAKASMFLGKEPFLFEQAKEDMNTSITFVISRRNSLQKDLK
jgi:hypothetical protein